MTVWPTKSDRAIFRSGAPASANAGATAPAAIGDEAAIRGPPSTRCSAEGDIGVKEASDMTYEQVRGLEQGTVAGVRLQDELCVENVFRQDVGIDCRHHDVVPAVDHERGLLDPLELCIGFSLALAPTLDGSGLGLH